jgi:hypothetical protein
MGRISPTGSGKGGYCITRSRYWNYPAPDCRCQSHRHWLFFLRRMKFEGPNRSDAGFAGRHQLQLHATHPSLERRRKSSY